MHLKEKSSETNAGLTVGSYVNKNTVVGLVGNTGDSSGAHLHFSVIVDGGRSAVYNTTIDPLVFFVRDEFKFKGQE